MVNNLYDSYLHHYQVGSGMPVFRGADYQYGNGLGNILRSVGRFLLPLLTGAASQFISSTAEGLNRGQTFKESAKQSIGPTLSGTVGALGTSIQQRLQKGSGRKRRSLKNYGATKRARVYKTRFRKGNTSKKFMASQNTKSNF